MSSAPPTGKNNRVHVDDALETLVNQFADPMSFFRELIQNALDAGSPEIEVRVEHEEPGADGRGLMTVFIDDFGEGMDAEIIDTRLTRLFSSSKDDDFTKIGRFGIGFVSVFAIEPEAVIVDTSRGGENWRVIFRHDRTFERVAMDVPFDGTTVRILKRVNREGYRAFERRAREVVTFWCRHAAAEIRFQGDVINEPFDVVAPVKVSYEEEGTRVVAGYIPDSAPFFGFYNRGLTLFEGHEAHIPLVTFKVSSRYLEHTLTRDNVLRDNNYHKAMAVVARLAARELPRALFEGLQAALDGGSESELDALFSVLRTWLDHCRLTGHQVPEWARRDYEVFASPSGSRYPLQAVMRAGAHDHLYYDIGRSPVTDALESGGKVVVLCRTSKDPARAALEVLRGGQVKRASRRFCTALPARSDREAERWDRLRSAVQRLLDDFGARLKRVEVGRLRYPGTVVAHRVAITQGELGELTPIEEAGLLPTSLFRFRRVLVLNADHPMVGSLLDLSEREPETAAYLVTKVFLLREELPLETDARLATLAMERRCRRSTT